MAEITLVAEAGRPVGSAAARRLRHQGRIPAVIYGHGSDPMAVSVVARELRTALSTEAGLNALLSLQVDGAEHLAMARDIQRDPVRHTVVHVDFQIVDRNETMAADVPVNLVGEAIEVAHADGIVDQQLFTLPVKAKPGRIPPLLELDISTLTVGGSLRVSDLTLPDGVETELDPETPVVSAAASRMARAEGEGEGVEGEAGAPAAGGAGGGSAEAAAEGEAPAASDGAEG